MTETQQSYPVLSPDAACAYFDASGLPAGTPDIAVAAVNEFIVSYTGRSFIKERHRLWKQLDSQSKIVLDVFPIGTIYGLFRGVTPALNWKFDAATQARRIAANGTRVEWSLFNSAGEVSNGQSITDLASLAGNECVSFLVRRNGSVADVRPVISNALSGTLELPGDPVEVVSIKETAGIIDLGRPHTGLMFIDLDAGTDGAPADLVELACEMFAATCQLSEADFTISSEDVDYHKVTRIDADKVYAQFTPRLSRYREVRT